MQPGAILAAFALGAFTVAVLAVGVRLLLLARRTLQLPELLIGLTFLGCGAGYLLMVVAARAPDLAGHAQAVHLLGRSFYSVGCASVATATWRIFRPAGALALAVVCAVFLGLGASFVADLLFSERSFRVTQPLFWVGFCANAFSFAWAAFESFRYHGMQRRQIRIGLSDPAIARRILLWGVASAAIFLGFPVAAWSLVATGDSFAPVPRLVTSLLALTASICIWAAFFPHPKRLVRAGERLRGR